MSACAAGARVGMCAHIDPNREERKKRKTLRKNRGRIITRAGIGEFHFQLV